MSDYVSVQTVTKPSISAATVLPTNLDSVVTAHSALQSLAETYAKQLDDNLVFTNTVALPWESGNDCFNFCDLIDGLEKFEPPADLNLPPVELESYPSYVVPAPISLPIGNVDFEFVPPTPPSEISPTFNWIATEYTSVMWQALYDKLHSDIINGGTGLTEAVHNAIVSKEQEARRINQDREYTKAISAAGATGFNLPSGHIASVQVEMGRENLSLDQQALDTLIIKDFDLATENTRFAVTSGIELEKLLRATWDAIENRGLEAAKVEGQYIIAVYEANIKAYIAAWQGVTLELEAEKLRIESIIETNKGEIEIFIGRNDAYKTQVEAITALNEGSIDIRKGEVDVYRSELEASIQEFQAGVAELNAKIEVGRLALTETIEENKFNLQKRVSGNELEQRANEANGRFYSQLAASALGGINAGMSAGSTVSASRSESLSNTSSLYEGHAIEHAA